MLLSFFHHSLQFYILWTDFCLGLFRFNSMVGHVKLSTTCAFPIFQKAKAFFYNYFFLKLNYLCELLFSIALWIINTRSIFSLVPLKIFWNFWNSSRKKSTQKQPFSGVYKIDVLKKFANFTKKHQCWSHFLKKSPEIKRLQHRCFPVNFAKLLRAPFLHSTSGMKLEFLF